MSQTDEYSSLPLILATCGAVVLSFVVGWLLFAPSTGSWTLGTQAANQEALPLPVQPPWALPETAAAEADSADVLPPLDILPPLAPPIPESEATAIDVEAELRKARLAAAADLLVAPPEGNALYYYGRILKAEPEHARALAELDAILARIALNVSERLTADDIDVAYELTAYVARQRPDHPLVAIMRDTLNERSNQLAERAMAYTRNGNDDAAADVLDTLDQLPGVDANVATATRQYVTSLREARDQEERDRIEAERLADEQAVTEWSEKVRGAIKAGQLVSPDGDSARDFLAERDGPKETKDVLTDELLSALLQASEQSIDAGNFESSETMVAAVATLREDASGLSELRGKLHRKLIEAEEAKILEPSDFVRFDKTAARYPQVAERLGITGWVDVLFTVQADGTTGDIVIAAAEPETVFDTSAVEAVEQWTFQPRMYRGERLNQRARARLVFRLD